MMKIDQINVCSDRLIINQSKLTKKKNQFTTYGNMCFFVVVCCYLAALTIGDPWYDWPLHVGNAANGLIANGDATIPLIPIHYHRYIVFSFNSIQVKKNLPLNNPCEPVVIFVVGLVVYPPPAPPTPPPALPFIDDIVAAEPLPPPLYDDVTLLLVLLCNAFDP